MYEVMVIVVNFEGESFKDLVILIIIGNVIKEFDKSKYLLWIEFSDIE